MKEFEKYEELVSSLVKVELMKDIHANGYKVFRQKKYKGKSGQTYAVDVSVEFELAGMSYLTIIECKDYNRSIDVSIINELYGRLNDIGAQKGIIVTTKGFQEGALTAAKSYKIGCVIVNDLGWQPFIGDPGFYFEQSEKLSNYFKKITNKPFPNIIDDNLHLFIPEFNSTNEFCETNENRYGRFIDHGFIIVEEGEPLFTLSANGLINFWVLCLESMDVN